MKRDRASGEALDHHASASKLAAAFFFFGLESAGGGLPISFRAARSERPRTRAGSSSARGAASCVYRCALSSLRSQERSQLYQMPGFTCSLARISASPAANACSRKFCAALVLAARCLQTSLARASRSSISAVGLKLARELVSSICVSFSLLTQFPAEGSFRPGALHAGPELLPPICSRRLR